jgi:hypothetical protein
MDALLVVAESGLSLKPTRESRRLQGVAVQRSESEQGQIGQLREPEGRTEPTLEQPATRARNAPHGCSLPHPPSLGYMRIWWG